ncbi:uncharacterized protein LOC132195738 [Neocloeon triangulifer]|uniref:uncharacterized protein LOC132195738 n=1 Tax=Neocloeon triangulifer TaxID=2078957 RepID=UPI00286EC6A4|nr:uncharacterized protein LOC132195738 [Neocloeon triangulifer]
MYTNLQNNKRYIAKSGEIRFSSILSCSFVITMSTVNLKRRIKAVKWSHISEFTEQRIFDEFILGNRVRLSQNLHDTLTSKMATLGINELQDVVLKLIAPNGQTTFVGVLDFVPNRGNNTVFCPDWLLVENLKIYNLTLVNMSIMKAQPHIASILRFESNFSDSADNRATLYDRVKHLTLIAEGDTLLADISGRDAQFVLKRCLPRKKVLRLTLNNGEPNFVVKINQAG